MHNTLFSIIIPTYNRLNTLIKTIDLLIDQTFDKKNYEIIVMDDFSNDDTELHLKKYYSNKIVYKKNSRNIGRSANRNNGIKYSKGQYILFVDDDIWVGNDFVQRHYNVHKRYAVPIVAIGLVKPSIFVPNTAINEYLNHHHNWCHQEMKQNRDRLPFNFCKTANLSAPKSLLLDMGGFDERFKEYGGEDTDLGYRLAKNDVKMIFVGNAVGYHYHDEKIENIADKEIQKIKNSILFSKIHPDFKSNNKSFFVPYYNKVTGIKYVIYNMAKVVLFRKFARLLNYSFIKRVNEKTVFRRFTVYFALPLLKIQNQFNEIRRMSFENRY